MKSKNGLIVSAILMMMLLISTLFLVKIVSIKGHELGVVESWSHGVETNLLYPGTYFLFPGFNKTVYHYDASSQVFVMNDKNDREEKVANGRQKDSYLVQSSEGQDMKISMNLRWRLNPEKLTYIHKTVRTDIEEKLIRPVLMRVVKDEATKRKAIDAYSGEGLVQLQTSIQTSLSGSGEGRELSERGITIENFVIEHIELDPQYIAEIKGKQVATQKALRAAEEQKAAEADALVAKAKAQAEYNTKLVGQQLLATNLILQAMADNEKVVIAAKAKQQELQFEAEGKRQAMESIAKGTLAQGQAEAKAIELKLKAWEAAGGDAYPQVEIAKALASGIQNIQGYIPERMTINTISKGFVDAVNTVAGSGQSKPVISIPTQSNP